MTEGARYGLPLPGVDLADDEAMQSLHAVPLRELQQKKKRKRAPINDDNESSSAAKRRKAASLSAVDDSADHSIASFSEASNDGTAAVSFSALRYALASSSSAAPSGSSTPNNNNSRGHRRIKIDDCLMCCASAITVAGLDMFRVPTYVTEWIHAQLAEHKWHSIWKDMEQLSKYLCAQAYKNGIELHYMTADDWLDHYRNETRDQFVELAANQIDYRMIHHNLKDSLFYEPDDQPGKLQFSHQNAKHVLEFLKANLRLDGKAIEMAKATLTGGNNSQVDNARRMPVVDYVLNNASIN